MLRPDCGDATVAQGRDPRCSRQVAQPWCLCWERAWLTWIRPKSVGNAALALGAIGDTSAVEPMLELVHDGHLLVRVCGSPGPGLIGDAWCLRGACRGEGSEHAWRRCHR